MRRVASLQVLAALASAALGAQSSGPTAGEQQYRPYVAALLLALLGCVAWALYLWQQRRVATSRARELAVAGEQWRERAERYERAVRAAGDGLWEWDLVRNEIYLSPRWQAMLGYAEHEMGSRPDEWLQRVHPADAPQLRAALAAHLAGAAPRLECEYRVRHRDGGYRWMLARGLAERGPGGEPSRVAGAQSDVTERKQAEEQLLRGALHDPLTGLPNRALFIELVGQALARSRRSASQRCAVLFFDIDRFKLVNDSVGHAAGDALLAAVGRRMQDALGPGDAVARLGGDEFAVLLSAVPDARAAVRVAERLQGELARPLTLHGTEMFATASVGVAVGGTEHDRAEELLQDADLAMYRARARGAGGCEVFDADMRVTARARLALETDLRRAVERREFEVHYQPIVRLGSEAISGFEALVRWRHPERGLINAAAFVPLAEETGLIVPIGQWVLAEACRQTQGWQKRFPAVPPLAVSVNVSPRELLHPGFVAEVERALAESDLPRGSLRLEITEGVFVDDPEAAIGVLQRVRALDVQLHLDDFGTGYSSLSYLHRFPISTVKIDRYFVSRMMANDECYEIVRSILTLARNLGMDVIAEGAETEEQRARLQSLDCAYLQGYLYSRPVEAQEAGDLLAAGAGRPRGPAAPDGSRPRDLEARA